MEEDKKSSVQLTQDLKSKITSEFKANPKKELKPLRIHDMIFQELNKDKAKFRKLIRLAYSVKKGLKNDYDWVGALSGREGRGKSTLLIILLALIDVTFTMERRLSLLPENDDIKNMFKKTRRFGALGIDEAIRSLHKQDWYSTVQKEIVRMYATERFQNKATLLAIPRFKDLNENFRNHRINCWLHVVDRGVAFVYVPIDISYFSDPWFMDEMEKKYLKMIRLKKGQPITLDDMRKLEQGNPCFVDVIEFPDLPATVKEAYLNLKIQARVLEEQNQGIEISKDKIRSALALKIYNERSRGINASTLAEEYQLNKNAISKLKEEGKKIYLQSTRKKQSSAIDLADSVYGN